MSDYAFNSPAESSSGGTPVTTAPQALNHESDATYDYYAFAPPGTATASALWQVFRINMATLQKQYADGNAKYDNVGQGMSGFSYS